jgi:predicted dinucleotide-binding enzyme
VQIGVLGATGPAGKGLAARFAEAGHDVIAGSRDAARAAAAVDELRDRWGDRVAAFHLVPASALLALDRPLDSDVVVVADDDEAREVVLSLAAAIPGAHGLDGGTLANAIGIETFAAVLLTINLRHRGKGALRVVGVEGRGG